MIIDITNYSNEFIDGYRKALLDVHEDIQSKGGISNYDLEAMLMLLKQKGRD